MHSDRLSFIHMRNTNLQLDALGVPSLDITIERDNDTIKMRASLVHTLVEYSMLLFTTLLLGHSRSGASFRDVFSISVALSLSAVLQLSNITPGQGCQVIMRKIHVHV